MADDNAYGICGADPVTHRQRVARGVGCPLSHWSARLRLLVLVMLFLAVTFQSARTQVAERVLPGSPVCAQCSLTARLVATLGSPGDSVLLSDWPLSVGLTLRGHFLADDVTQTSVAVFSDRGDLTRVIGRSGQGPNEFPRATKWFLNRTGDSLYIVANGRVFVYGPELTEARRFSIPIVPRYAVLPNGSVAQLPTASTDSAMSVAVHSASGQPLSRFIVRPRSSAPGCRSCRYTTLSAAQGANEFWLLHSDQYRLERWSSSGVHIESVRIEGSDWRDAWLAEMRNGWGGPTGARVPGLEVARRADGLLLVTAQGPAASGGSPTGAGRPFPRSMAGLAAQQEPGLDQVFDIIDPQRGVLASTRIANRGFVLMADGRHAMRPIEHSSGITQVEIWELVLQR
jgi:hypothetical protein